MTTEEWTKHIAQGMHNIYQPTEPVIDCYFSIGDVVCLKSGGKNMTVAGYPSPLGDVDCAISNDGTVEVYRVNQKCLKRIRWWNWIWP